MLEVHRERVDPEVVATLGITGCDVARYAFVEAESSEQPEAGRQADLDVRPFGIEVIEVRHREARRDHEWFPPVILVRFECTTLVVNELPLDRVGHYRWPRQAGEVR